MNLNLQCPSGQLGQYIALLMTQRVENVIAPPFFKFYTRIPLANYVIVLLPLTKHPDDSSGERLN